MDDLKAWLQQTPYAPCSVTVASADASFRKYYRLACEETHLILMDATQERATLQAFVDVTLRLRAQGAGAPEIVYNDSSSGYLILEDLGSTHYLDLLDADNFEALYEEAIQGICIMQRCDVSGLPVYDKPFLHLEMDLMKTWYFERLLHVTLDARQERLLAHTLDSISDVVLSQPQGLFVHRDYHSRNLLRTPDKRLGIIDYQDAMSGSLTYDLVSLLKDCYIAFDRERIETLALRFRDMQGVQVSDADFLKWFDFTGLQRHIKVLGIFSRLFLRDGKAGYLKDIPLTRHYALESASRYPETQAFAQMLEGFDAHVKAGCQ